MTCTATFRVAGVPEAVGEARAAVTRLAAGRVRGETLRTTRLLVSELVTNGILHGGTEGPLELSVRLADGTVRVDVTDWGTGFAPEARAPEPSEAGGWGLLLVERLADSWGVHHDGGTHVWFEVAEPQ